MSPLKTCVAVLAASAMASTASVYAQQSTAQQPLQIQPQAIDQAGLDQAGQGLTQPGQQQGTPHTAFYGARGEQSQQGPTVQEALVKKLIKANDAEIELARMAQQQSDNQEVKQLTRMIIQDHQALNQKLQQFTSHSSNPSSTSRDHSTTGNQPWADRERESRTQAGQNQFGQNQSTQTQPGQTTSATTTRRQSDRLNSQDAQSKVVPQQLCDIGEQACDNALRMTKEMLGEYQGQDFNMAFLGQQCVAHTMMLAELKAIESEGPQEMRSVAQEAKTKVEQHLEKVKQLAKKLEDDSRSASRS